MPQMKEVRRRPKKVRVRTPALSKGAVATDYRAITLEAVACTPNPGATMASITVDVRSMYPEYDDDRLGKMVQQLRKEGLIGRGDMDSTDEAHYFITKPGLEYLTTKQFGKKPPAPHERPGARRKKKP